MIFILIWFIITVTSQIPECSYQCDDPICAAVCEPICKPIVCNILCSQGESSNCNPIQCGTQCPTDQDILGSCPLCEITCQPLRCLPNNICEIQCHAIECSWKCVKPNDCPYPRCQLQCQAPACEFSIGSITNIHLFLSLLIINLLFIF